MSDQVARLRPSPVREVGRWLTALAAAVIVLVVVPEVIIDAACGATDLDASAPELAASACVASVGTLAYIMAALVALATVVVILAVTRWRRRR